MLRSLIAFWSITHSVINATSFTQEVRREPVVAEQRAEFHHSILVGVRQLAREHIRIAELGIRIEKGDASAEQELLDEVIAGLPKDDQRDVRDAPPSAETLAEMLLSWKGHEAFQAVRDDAAKRGRPITTDDLVEVIYSDRLRELPEAREEPEVAAFVSRVEQLAGQPVPVRLWWPTVGYLLFGALHTPSFWPEEAAERERARAQLIQDLLAVTTVSVDPEAARRVVDLALRPPLRGKCERKAVTCAIATVSGLRGRVGFTRDHLEYVSRFNQDHDAERRTGAPGTPWAANFRYVADFMAMMKLRILLELDPAAIGKPGPLGCKYGTIDEALAYYKQVLDERGIQSLWVEGRHDVEQILAGRFPSPLDAKIALLDEKLADSGLADPERDRLKKERDKLAREREGNQRQIAGFITFQFGYLAPIDQVATEMHQLDALATPDQQQAVLIQGWSALGLRDAGWAKRVAIAHLDSDDHYSYPAIVGCTIALGRNAEDPQCAKALFELATRGTPDERSTAITHAQYAPVELAQEVYEAVMSDVEALLRRNPDVQARRPFGDDRLYSTLMWSTIGMLFGRRKESWTRESLLETFDRNGVNLWQGGSAFSPDLQNGNREVLEWVASMLSDEDYGRLLEKGRIPADLKRVHDEAKRR